MAMVIPDSHSYYSELRVLMRISVSQGAREAHCTHSVLELENSPLTFIKSIQAWLIPVREV